MPNKSFTTTQGLCWDQIAKGQFGSEKQMGALLPENADEMDTLFFGGETVLTVPDVKPLAVRSLPPWERM